MQQINLYQPIFRKQEKIFSARAMLQGGAMIVGGLLLVFAYASWQTAALNRQVAELERQRAQGQARLVELARKYPKRAQDPELASRAERVRTAVVAKQKVLAAMGGKELGNREGFTVQLEALARQRPPMVWLKTIGISDGGREFLLAGSALKPEQIPQYLQRLSTEPAFAGSEFRSFVMNRPEKGRDQVDFTLRTTPEEGSR